MNWRWILMLATLGVLVSLASIMGWIPSSMWLTAGLVLVVAALLGHNVKDKLFLHGFLTAVIWTLIGGALQFAFWDTFMANNPEVQEKMAKVPEGMNIRPFMAIGIVVGGAIWGAVLGLLTMLAGKLLGEKPQAEPVSQDQTPES
jgi:NhaP-type Na+/H+ or K+/H+ antiporter